MTQYSDTATTLATTTDTLDDARMFLTGARYVLRRIRAVANKPNQMFAVLHELDCEITKLEAQQ